VLVQIVAGPAGGILHISSRSVSYVNFDQSTG
jgi:hypothetical protein